MIDIRPNVGKTIESLKSSGYDIYFAIADIIDNSLDANANKITIEIDFETNAIKIIDNGTGMNRLELIESLRLGSVTGKDGSNLGKFGFGLKSASFSQCNILKIGTIKEGNFNEITFDINKSVTKNDWIAYDSNSLKEYFDTKVCGTIVEWNDLYRLGKNKSEIHDKLVEIAGKLINFISTTFYVFIEKGIEFYINDLKISPTSPFYEKNFATKNIDSQTLPFDKELIKLNAYDLSNVKNHSHDTNYLETQGIYVFRNNRFIKNIGWISLSKHPSYNNIRIKLDIGAAEDDILNIDFKKSNVEIPAKVKKVIRIFENNAIKIQRRNQRTKRTKMIVNESSVKYVYVNGDKLNVDHIYVNTFLKNNNINSYDLNEFLKNIKELDKISSGLTNNKDYKLYLFDLLEDLYKSKSQNIDDDFFNTLKYHSPFKENIDVVENYRRSNTND